MPYDSETRQPESSQLETEPQRPKRPIGHWLLIGLFIYASVFVLSQAKAFLVPVVLAFLLAMVFGPVRRFLDRRGIPAGLSSFAIVLVLVVGFLAMVGGLAVPVSKWIDNAPRIQNQVQYKLSNLSRSMSGIFKANQQIKQMTDSDSANVPKVKVQNNKGLISEVMTLGPSALAQVIFTLVLLLFLLASGDMFYEKLVHVMPTLGDKRQAMRIAHDIERKLSRYLLTITLINAGLGVAVGMAMWAYGMPSPLVFGVIACLFNFIPYLGAFVGIAVSAAVALLTFNWIGWMLIVPATYLALTTLEGQMITPYFIGRRLSLNTVVVFITVSFWAWLWSAVGMIVAVPLLVAMKTFCEHIDALDSLGDFLSERHAEKLTLPEENGERGRAPGE